jgi:cell wall-associated NlpC family hydrolase
MKRTRTIVIGVLPVVILLLACGAPAGVVRGPRWACPSPQPLPYGDAGPPKAERRVCSIDPVTHQQVCHTEVEYYAIWEREYGPGGTLLNGQAPVEQAPFPSPTPYGRMGNTYLLGQRVELAPLHVLVTARAGQPLDARRQIFLVELAWHNPTAAPVPFSYERQVWLRAVTRADGTLLTGDDWGVDPRQAAELSLAPPAAIPPGDSRVLVPVVGPRGQPKTVELRMVVDADSPEEARASPTPNRDLRSQATRTLIVQWTAAAPAGPACDDAGALTDWSSDEVKAIPRDAQVGLAPPPGAERVVQLALAQVGKRYVWGAAGPETFDCSGLMYWAYAKVGIQIPRTTATQWPALRHVAAADWRAGDLVYMDTRTAREGFRGFPERVTHVGMLADLDGDGRWDLIHAASPRLGVRYELDVLGSRYYAPRIFPEGRTAR